MDKLGNRSDGNADEAAVRRTNAPTTFTTARSTYRVKGRRSQRVEQGTAIGWRPLVRYSDHERRLATSNGPPALVSKFATIG